MGDIGCVVSSVRGNLAVPGFLGQQHTWARHWALCWPLHLPQHRTPGVDSVPGFSHFLMSQAELSLTKDALSLRPDVHVAVLMLTPTCKTH